MHLWTYIFLVLTAIAGLLGFTSVAGAAAGIGQILFFVFLTLMVISLVSRVVQGKAR